MTAVLPTMEIGPTSEIGGLTLVALLGQSNEASDVLSAADALAKGALEVAELETPTVPELVATVKGTVPVLLVEGEVLVGIAQDRTLNVSVLCAADAATTIPVACVEAGRWGGRSAAVRMSSSHTASAMRAAKLRSMQADESGRRLRRVDQGQVWDDVERYAQTMGVNSETSALDAVHTSMTADMHNQIAELAPVPGQVGVAAVTGRYVLGIDVFESEASLQAHLQPIVTGYALDAMTLEPNAFDVAAVEQFLAAVDGATVDTQPGVGLGEELHLRSPQVTGVGLRFEGRLLHLAAFAVPGV